MSDINEPYYYDKLFVQLMGYRFIKKCEFASGAEERLAEFAEVAAAAGQCSCKFDKRVINACIADDCLHGEDKVMIQLAKSKILSMSANPDNLQFESVDGLGIVVVATRKIFFPSPIIEYTGTVQFGEPEKNQPFSLPITRVPAGEKMYINSNEEGNQSRMLPNSFQPNCEVQEWVVGKQIRLFIAAVKNIEEGEVLTLRYPHYRQGGHK